MPIKSMLSTLAVLVMGCGGTPATAATSVTTDSVTKDSVAKVVAAKPKPGLTPMTHRLPVDTVAASGVRPLVRETYTYEGSSRDPFQPLVLAVERGPELADLRLVAILFDDREPAGSIATFRDIGNDKRYTLTPGQRLGRISVVSVSRNTVKLREDDFGTARDQTYALRKPEDGKP
jgi:hypothetical protein